MAQNMFQRSAQTQWLIDKLREVDDFISYDDLSDAIGKDVRSDGYGALTSARNILLNQHHIVFDPVRGKGLKRLHGEDVLGPVMGSLKRIRNTARKGKKVSTCIRDVSDLPRDKRAQLLASQSYLALIDVALKKDRVKQVTGRVESAGIEHSLNMGEMLKALQGKNGGGNG